MKPLQNGDIMNKQDFTILFEEFNPNLSKSSNELETLTKVYPYFQTAHFLYLKSLQNQEKINFNSVLEKTAVITYDRSLLMNWINTKYEFQSNKLEIKKYFHNWIGENSLPEKKPSGQPLLHLAKEANIRMR